MDRSIATGYRHSNRATAGRDAAALVEALGETPQAARIAGYRGGDPEPGASMNCVCDGHCHHHERAGRGVGCTGRETVILHGRSAAAEFEGLKIVG